MKIKPLKDRVKGNPMPAAPARIQRRTKVYTVPTTIAPTHIVRQSKEVS